MLALLMVMNWNTRRLLCLVPLEMDREMDEWALRWRKFMFFSTTWTTLLLFPANFHLNAACHSSPIESSWNQIKYEGRLARTGPERSELNFFALVYLTHVELSIAMSFSFSPPLHNFVFVHRVTESRKLSLFSSFGFPKQAKAFHHVADVQQSLPFAFLFPSDGEPFTNTHGKPSQVNYTSRRAPFFSGCELPLKIHDMENGFLPSLTCKWGIVALRSANMN